MNHLSRILFALFIFGLWGLAPNEGYAACSGNGGVPFNCDSTGTTPSLSDLVLGGQVSTGKTVKYTLGQIQSAIGGGGGGGAVSSVFGRTGAVIAQTGDYSFPNISGTVAASQLPAPTNSTIGGIKSTSSVPNQWIAFCDTSGTCTQTQPGFSNLSGNPSSSQLAANLSAALDSTFGNVQGDILYRNASGWTVLPPGTSGNVLETQGTGANIMWGSITGSGCVTSGTSILEGNGSGGCANISVGANLTFTSGILAATGAVTSVTNSDSTTVVSPTTGAVQVKVATNGVAYANVQQVSASKLLGNPTGSTANISEIGLLNGLAFSGTSLGPTAPDNTSTANYTISATDMAGQRNFATNGSLTATIPAISSSIFANGMSSLITNQFTTGPLSVSTTPTINGCALTGSPYQIHSYGFWSLVSNGTSLDCAGFPGFDTITQNALTKFSDASGATTASAITDNGTVVSSSESMGVGTTKGAFKTIANDGSTGTTQNKLAKLTSAGAAILAGTTDTNGEQGIVISATSTAGNAQIAYQGVVACATDATATAGHFVGISTSVAGDCTDVGTSAPLGSQTIGQFVSGGTGAGTYNVSLALGLTNTAGGGSGTVNAGTAGQLAYYATSTTAVSGESNATVSAGALSLGSSGTAGSVAMGNATSGVVTLQPVTGALGTVTASLPANTGTIAELNLAQTWTAAQALGSSSTATTQSANDNSTKLATTAYVDRPTNLPTPGSSATLSAPRSYYVCTTTCTITLPTPAAGDEFCVRNDNNVTTVITFAAISGVQFENTNFTSYKTANTSIVSGGAAGDKLCVLGRDSTHYLVASFNGTWS